MTFFKECIKIFFSGKTMTTKSFSSQCITKNIVYIKENVASVDRILDLLLQNDVIKMFEREDIVAKMPGERVHAMIDLVLKRKAQQAFLEALKQTGQNLIVEQIMNTQKEFIGMFLMSKKYIEVKRKTKSENLRSVQLFSRIMYLLKLKKKYV